MSTTTPICRQAYAPIHCGRRAHNVDAFATHVLVDNHTCLAVVEVLDLHVIEFDAQVRCNLVSNGRLSDFKELHRLGGTGVQLALVKVPVPRSRVGEPVARQRLPRVRSCVR